MTVPRLRFAIACAAVALLACLPGIELALPPTWNLCALVLPTIFAISVIGIGLNIITGFAGQLNLGVAAFVAIGAYTYAILTSNIYPFGIGFWPGLIAATLAAAVVGAALAIPTTRLRGDYLAIVTLGFGEIVQDLLKNLEPITKGTAGIDPVPNAGLFGHSLAGGPGIYWLYLALMLLSALVARNLRWSRLGRQWVAVREDELAARACGVQTARARLTAFAWGSAFAGAGGALLVALIGTSADPGYYDFQLSIMVLCAVIVGGMGSIGGVMLGTALMFGINSVVLEPLTRLIQGKGATSVISAPSNWKYLVFGLALIVTMRLRPGGLWPARELRAPTAPTGPGGAP